MQDTPLSRPRMATRKPKRKKINYGACLWNQGRVAALRQKRHGSKPKATRKGGQNKVLSETQRDAILRYIREQFELGFWGLQKNDIRCNYTPQTSRDTTKETSFLALVPNLA